MHLLVKHSNVCILMTGGTVDTDTGADNLESQDTGGAPAGDPSIINPPNKQGYGRDVQTHVEPTKKPSRISGSLKPTTTTEQTIAEQSVQAALQFGVLVNMNNIKCFFANKMCTYLENASLDKISHGIFVQILEIGFESSGLAKKG